jgi:magnesium chelatase family protein
MKNNIYTASILGIDPKLILCEATSHTSPTIHFSMMGINFGFRQDFKKKMLSILQNNNIEIPRAEYVLNLLPIDISKEGASFDLPIAICILIEAHQLNADVVKFLNDSIIVGELSLSGEVFAVRNVISLALNLSKLGKKRLIIPKGNMRECSLLPECEIYMISNIMDIFDLSKLEKLDSSFKIETARNFNIDINEVYGHTQAKRGLEIAAAGKHNILFFGPPGSGKTMLAQRIPTILPPLSMKQIIETTRIYSSSGLLTNNEPIIQPPFRRPHHSVSVPGLMGGGAKVQAGEVSLAHNGVLFMDEFLEFSRIGIDGLRECLEEGKIHIKRSGYAVTFPASFILVAALNPCPCGYFGDIKNKCSCPAYKIKMYLNIMSGAVRDRIDLQVHLTPIDYECIKKDSTNNG